MAEYFSSFRHLDITRPRRKDQISEATLAEQKDYLSLTGSLNWLGHGVISQAALVASHLQQSIRHLTVAHLCTANKCLPELRKLNPLRVWYTVRKQPINALTGMPPYRGYHS